MSHTRPSSEIALNDAACVNAYGITERLLRQNALASRDVGGKRQNALGSTETFYSFHDVLLESCVDLGGGFGRRIWEEDLGGRNQYHEKKCTPKLFKILDERLDIFLVIRNVGSTLFRRGVCFETLVCNIGHLPLSSSFLLH